MSPEQAAALKVGAKVRGPDKWHGEVTKAIRERVAIRWNNGFGGITERWAPDLDSSQWREVTLEDEL